MSDPFPVFDESGHMLGNLTSIQGQQPTANALTSSDFTLPGATLPTDPAITYPTTPSSTPSSTASTQPQWNNPSTWKLPSFKDVWTGMQKGPQGADTVAGFDVEKYFEEAMIFLVGLVFIAGGLFLLAKETSIGQSTIRELRNSIPKK